MPSVTNQGGTLAAENNPDNQAGVIQAVATQTGAATAQYVVTLVTAPRIANFTVGQALRYNAKGTSNANADNRLVVRTVDGPAKYTCDGPWPMNI